jgi:hypothetical protein
MVLSRRAVYEQRGGKCRAILNRKAKAGRWMKKLGER